MIKLTDILEGKYDVYHSKNLTFVTYGGLSLTKQKGYKKETYHSPPTRHGVYAFVWPYIERFLLGGYHDPKERGKGARNRIEYIRDKSGKIIDSDHPEYNKYLDTGKFGTFARWVKNKKHPTAQPSDDDYVPADKHILYRHIKPKKFSYNGPIWHHLKEGLSSDEILDQNKEWVKTDMDVFIRQFKKEAKKSERTWAGLRNTFPYSMDHLEVFIDKKI